MKRIIFLVVLLVFLLGAWFVVKLLSRHTPADELRNQFYAALDSGDANQLYAIMAPSLQEQFDPPVLAAWQAAVNQHLGPHDASMAINEVFAEGEEYTDGAWVVTCSGEAVFEHGQYHLELAAADDLLTEIVLNVEAMDNGLWLATVNTTEYEERGSLLLMALSQGEYLVAREYMDMEARWKVSEAALESQVTAFLDHAGPAGAVAFRQPPIWRPAVNEHVLTLFYIWRGDMCDAAASVVFDFSDGRKGKLVSFDLLTTEELPAAIAGAMGQDPADATNSDPLPPAPELPSTSTEGDSE
jgi:hypothetical protein